MLSSSLGTVLTTFVVGWLSRSGVESRFVTLRILGFYGMTCVGRRRFQPLQGFNQIGELQGCVALDGGCVSEAGTRFARVVLG